MTAAATHRVPSEHAEQCEVVQWFYYAYPHLRRTLWATANGLHIAGTPGQRRLKWAKFQQAGGLQGTPDLVLMVPSSGKHGLYIEMKRRNAAPSETKAAQHDFADLATRMGYRAEICRGADVAKELIIDYLKPMEPRIAV